YRKRSPENSKSGAVAYEVSLRGRLARGLPLHYAAPSRELTFEQFASQWFEQYVIPNNRPSEQYAKKMILSAVLIPFFGNAPLREVSAHQIEKFKAHEVAKGLSNKTINNRLAILGKCLRCAHEWLGIQLPTIRLLRCPPPKTDYLTPT